MEINGIPKNTVDTKPFKKEGQGGFTKMTNDGPTYPTQINVTEAETVDTYSEEKGENE